MKTRFVKWMAGWLVRTENNATPVKLKLGLRFVTPIIYITTTISYTITTATPTMMATTNPIL